MSLYADMLRAIVLPYLMKRDNGRSSIGYWRQFEASQYWSQQQLLDYQWQRLQELLAHCYQKTGYYRRVMDERGLTPSSFRGLDDLSKLPILTRELIEKNTDALIADGYRKEDLQKFETGGTTTRRLELYRDVESANIKRAIAWRFEGYMGRKPCDKMCFFWPPHVDYHHHESAKVRFRRRYLDRERMYYTGGATEETLRGFYDDTMSFRPDFFKVFPSALFRFGEFVQANKLRPPTVTAIMSTGEILYPYQKELFENVFEAEVFDMYGSRETGNTAAECNKHDGRHIAQEISIVEFLKNGKPAAPGDEGEIVITDLTNYGFPLVRYALQDMGTYMAEPCSCGRTLPLMSAGVGRITDNFVAPDGSRHSGLSLTIYILRTGPPIGQCQIIQRSIDEFLVRVTNDPRPDEAVFDHIRKSIRRVTGDGVTIDIEVVAEIPKEKSGKIRLLKCEIPETEMPNADPRT